MDATGSQNTMGHHTMILPSELASVDRVEQAAERGAREAGFDADTVGQVAMVAREATVNAVLHGNRYDPARQVTATVRETDVALIVTVADQGSGFDADTVPDPLQPENLLRSSGRGIFLMRAYMDEVHFRQLHPGQEIVLIKYKSSGPLHGHEENT